MVIGIKIVVTGRDWLERGMKEFWGDGNFLLCDRFVVYMGVYVSQTHWTVHLRYVSLYVNYISLKDPNTKEKKKPSRDGTVPVLSCQAEEASVLNLTYLCTLILLLHMHISLGKIWYYFACVWTIYVYISQHIYIHIGFLLNVVYEIYPSDTSSSSCVFRAKCIHVMEYYIIKLSFLFLPYL